MVFNTTQSKKRKASIATSFRAKRPRDWSERVCRAIVLQAIRDIIEDSQFSPGARHFLLSEFGEYWIDGSGLAIDMVQGWVKSGCPVPDNLRRSRAKKEEGDSDLVEILAAHPFE